MGVLYHLRHPLLALDLIHEHVAGDLLIFQSMQRGSTDDRCSTKDYPISGRRRFSIGRAIRNCTFIEHRYAHDPTNWWVPNRACAEAMLRSAGFEIVATSGGGSLYLPRGEPPYPAWRRLSGAAGEARDDRSGDDLERAQQQIALGPRDRSRLGKFAEMARLAARAIAEPSPDCPGCSAACRRSIPCSSQNLAGQGRARRTSMSSRCMDFRSIGICGRSTIGQQRSTKFAPSPTCRSGCRRSASRASAPKKCRIGALARTAELLIGRAPRIHWYSLYDLPQAWPATTRHKEAEGSSYYRHFYMGLLREDGTPKPAAETFRALHAELGLCQWFHFEDHRLDDAVALDEAARRALSAHRPLLGRQLPPERARLVRPADGSACRVSMSPSPSASRRSIAGLRRITRARRSCREEFAEFCAAMISRYARRSLSAAAE